MFSPYTYKNTYLRNIDIQRVCTFNAKECSQRMKKYYFLVLTVVEKYSPVTVDAVLLSNKSKNIFCVQI